MNRFQVRVNDSVDYTISLSISLRAGAESIKEK